MTAESLRRDAGEATPSRRYGANRGGGRGGRGGMPWRGGGRRRMLHDARGGAGR